MKTRISRSIVRSSVFVAAIGSFLSVATLARADAETVVASSSKPEKTDISNSFEIGLGIGYTQGVGDVGTNVPSLTASGGPGISGELDLGWRIDPQWLVGVYGTTAWLSTGDAPRGANNNWTATAGIQGNYHFLPGTAFDPWVGLGAGWRGYWVNRGGGRDSRHGIDFARVQVGGDVPVAKGISISPFIGASAGLFLSQQLAQETSFKDINSPNVNFFLNGGVIGRFNL